MNCCDSWRHISDTWEVQGWSKANKSVASSPHLQMEYSHCNPSSDERQRHCLIYFSHLFNTIIDIFSLKMGCFCCKTACFFLFGPEGPGQEEEKVTGRNKKRRQAHVQLGYYGNAGRCWCQGISVWVKPALPASQKCLLTNMQLWGLWNRNTVMLSSNSTDVLPLVMVILLRRSTVLQYGGGGHHTAHGESSCSLRKQSL